MIPEDLVVRMGLTLALFFAGAMGGSYLKHCQTIPGWTFEQEIKFWVRLFGL